MLDRVPEGLWTEVHNTVQEVVTKTIPKKKKCKNAEWLPKETIHIAEKRRETKGKRERKRYIQLNTEFLRILRRNKKDFLSEQCKEIEENNRMGKTGDVFKKIGEIKETFHAKMGTIKERNSMDLTDAEDIKKSW